MENWSSVLAEVAAIAIIGLFVSRDSTFFACQMGGVNSMASFAKTHTRRIVIKFVLDNFIVTGKTLTVVRLR